MIYGNCVMSNKVQTISLRTRLGKILTRQYIIFIVTSEIVNSQLGEQANCFKFLCDIFSVKKWVEHWERRDGWSVGCQGCDGVHGLFPRGRSVGNIFPGQNTFLSVWTSCKYRETCGRELSSSASNYRNLEKHTRMATVQFTPRNQ